MRDNLVRRSPACYQKAPRASHTSFHGPWPFMCTDILSQLMGGGPRAEPHSSWRYTEQTSVALQLLPNREPEQAPSISGRSRSGQQGSSPGKQPSDVYAGLAYPIGFLNRRDEHMHACTPASLCHQSRTSVNPTFLPPLLPSALLSISPT